MSEGVYESGERRNRKRRQIAGIAAGVALVVGAGIYVTAAFVGGQDATVSGDTGAIAPIVSAEPSVEAGTLPPSSPAEPSVGIGPGTKGAQRQSSMPSPVPTLPPAAIGPGAVSDQEIAASQLDRLLQPRPGRSGVGIAANNERVSVRNEITPDGASVRVLSARYDLTQSWKLLAAGDDGRFVDGARCTQNIRTGDQPAGQIRPGVMLCWRTSAARSVVAIATGSRPQAVFTAAVVAREWANLG